jgi:two-component system chemotaxis response regulator CheB
LFRSAARSYGPQAIGVVLTGLLDDGASRLYAVKEQGGLAVVQDLFNALHASMPMQAMKAVAVDLCVPIAEMGALLVHLTNSAVEQEGGHLVSEQRDIEVKVAREDNSFESGIMKLGKLSPYTCPECHGILLQLKEGNLIRFRCHTGHAYSLNSLLAEVTESIETSLWNKLRGIEESEMLISHMVEHLCEANRFLQKAKEARRRANLVKQAVMSHETLSQDKLSNPAKEP